MTAGELLRQHGWEPLERPDNFPLWRKGDSGPVELAEALTQFHREMADGFEARTRAEWRAMKAEMEATND